jgi:hypothetical protein
METAQFWSAALLGEYDVVAAAWSNGVTTDGASVTSPDGRVRVTVQPFVSNKRRGMELVLDDNGTLSGVGLLTDVMTRQIYEAWMPRAAGSIAMTIIKARMRSKL